MHVSFLAHRRFLYLKVAALLVAASIVAYIGHDPVAGPNGGTWLGYTLGGIGAALILLLLWYGVRKRRFRSQLGTVRGWLSAHVYLGTALVVIVSLHSAFQFGWNIHTVAYFLMIAVIVTGLYGVYAYRRYPELITENRSDVGGSQAMLEEVASLEQQAVELADGMDEAAQQFVQRSLRGESIGGGVFAQLRGGKRNTGDIPDPSVAFPELSGSAREPRETAEAAEQGGGRRVERTRQLMDLISRRRRLVRRINRDIQQRALLQIWLYLHVPLSLGLFAALLAHVVAVFAYW